MVRYNLHAVLLVIFYIMVKKIIVIISLLFFYPPFVSVASAAKLPAGSLVKFNYPEVFLVSQDGSLRWIPNEETFEARGHSWEDIVALPESDLAFYTWGDALPLVELEPSLPTAAEMEQRVREYFADIPIMIAIAKCESGFLQFRSDGSIVRSPNGLYYGIFQIDKNIHGEYAKSLGMDIETIEGNMAYARNLYEAKGAQPWPTCAVLASPLKNDLQIGDEGTEVKALQKILNQNGFTVSSAGVGSPGWETTYFGELTRQAVQRFQCAEDIVCSGDEDTTGYGLVGPKTRAALNNL